jgi:hypothetical protein
MFKWFWRDSINRWLTAAFVVSVFVSVKSSSTACFIRNDFICTILAKDGIWFNDYTFGLSLSVIAGFIVWWLSVVWPMHKKRVLLKALLLESYDKVVLEIKGLVIEGIETHHQLMIPRYPKKVIADEIELGDDFYKYTQKAIGLNTNWNCFRGVLQGDKQLYDLIVYELGQLEKTINYVFAQLPDAEQQSLDLFVVFSQEIDWILRSPNALTEKDKHLEKFVLELLSWRATTDRKPYSEYDKIRRKIEVI